MNIVLQNRWKCAFFVILIWGVAIPTHAYFDYGGPTGKLFSQSKRKSDTNKSKSTEGTSQPISRVDLALKHQVVVRGGDAEGTVLDYTTIITNNGPDEITHMQPAIFLVSVSGLMLNPNEVVVNVKRNKAAQESNTNITYLHTYPSGDVFHILNFPKDGSLTLTYSAILQQPYDRACDFADCSVRIDAPSKGFLETNFKNNSASTRIGQFSDKANQVEHIDMRDAQSLEPEQKANKRTGLIDIPKIFSPNDDGINDLWIIPGIMMYPNCQIVILDRAENIVYQSLKGYHEPWNGQINNTGSMLPGRSNFHYKIDLNDESRQVIVGYVSIIR